MRMLRGEKPLEDRVVLDGKGFLVEKILNITGSFK